MKVIGESVDGYLISASKREIARLFGHYGEYDDEFKKQIGQNRASLVGLQINVSVAYEQLSWIRRRNAEFDELCKRLRATADSIQDSRPLFDAIVGDTGESS